MHKLILLVLFAAACAVRAQPLAQLPLDLSGKLPAAQRTQKTILVLPFSDLRGADYSRASPDAFIPVVNWFHQSHQLFYPDQAGILRTRDRRAGIVSVGAIAAAMPQLVTRTMRQMGLTDSASVAGTSAADTFDYVLTGQVRRTQFREHSSFLLALALGVFGVPYEFARYDLEYDVALFDSRDRTTPIFSRTYTWQDKRNIGHYYNRGWAYSMFVRGLEHTLPMMVGDISAVLATRG